MVSGIADSSDWLSVLCKHSLGLLLSGCVFVLQNC